MNAEVACLDISSADGDSSSTVCAVGLWDMTAKLVNVKDMTVIHTEELGGGMSYCYLCGCNHQYKSRKQSGFLIKNSRVVCSLLEWG